MLRAIGDQHSILAKPVNDHVDKIPVEPQLYVDCITGVHLEEPICVLLECFSCKLRTGGALFAGEFNVRHTVNTVGSHAVAGGVGKQIAIFVILAKLFSSMALGIHNPRVIRILNLISNPCWLIYNIYVFSIAGIVSEILVISSVVIAVIRLDILGKSQKLEVQHDCKN